MNIVVVDESTLNPGDLSWAELEAMGACKIYANSTPEEVLERCKDAEIIVTNKVPLDRETIAALPKLKYISVSATGYDCVDVPAATERGLPVTNVPIYGTRSVAQMVFALLLELTQHVGHHDRTVHEGKWSACENFCYWDYPMLELDGLTMGIVGYGRIGKTTAELARAFGMKVLAFDIDRARVAGDGAEFADLDRLFAESDVVSLHCPMSPGDADLINARRLKQMKPAALLINTSRGRLINEQDLADALNAGQIAGAGVDVLSSEPPSADNPLLKANNCVITPHIAWATRGARGRLLSGAVENVRAYLAGTPQNVVNAGELPCCCPSTASETQGETCPGDTLPA